MKKFLLYIALFFVIVCFVDYAFGIIVDKLCSTAKDGEMAKIHYIANRIDEDVVIMGSSRAYRHYYPMILEDSLKLSVYNAGASNMGIICNYGLYKAFKEHHKPKIIIYEVYQTDFSQDDITTYLDNLRLLRNNRAVREYISKISPDDKYKMFSSLYCYNTKWIYILQENVKASMTTEKGYAPDRGRLTYKPEKMKDMCIKDSLKVHLFRDFIKEVKDEGTQLFIMVSPLYYSDDFKWIGWAKEIAAENGILFFDFSKEPFFHENDDVFYDQIHLNEEGAAEYSKIIGHQLVGIGI